MVKVMMLFCNQTPYLTDYDVNITNYRQRRSVPCSKPHGQDETSSKEIRLLNVDSNLYSYQTELKFISLIAVHCLNQ